jgi:hypothetical protein
MSARARYCTDCKWFRLELITAPATELGKNATNALVMGRARIYFACHRPGQDWVSTAALLERSFISEPDPWDHCGNTGRYFTAKPAPAAPAATGTTTFWNDPR